MYVAEIFIENKMWFLKVTSSIQQKIKFMELLDS